MTPTQATTLIAAMRADTNQDVIDALAIGNVTRLVEIYNEPSAQVVWRSAVMEDEIMQNGFDWTQVDNLTVGKARIWEWMFNNQQQTINPSKANIRAGIDEAWKGTAAMLAVRAAVYVHCKRLATKAEAIFMTGTGTDVSPGTLTWEGMLDINTVAFAINENP